MLIVQEMLLLPMFHRGKHKTQRDEINCQSPGRPGRAAQGETPGLLCLSTPVPGIQPRHCYRKSLSFAASGNERG